MKLALGLLFGALVQAVEPAPQDVTPGSVEDQANEILAGLDPYDGSLTSGLREVERLVLEDRYDEGLVLSQRLLSPNAFEAWKIQQERDESSLAAVVRRVQPALDAVGLSMVPEAHRAEVHYARGVLFMRRGKHEGDPSLREASEGEYRKAVALASEGELRRDAIYNIGVGNLEEAERVRLEIPEVRERLGLPPMPQAVPVPPSAPGVGPQPPISAGPAPGTEPPDPIEIARGFYTTALDEFVERLRLEWRDDDTQANVELIQRRLRELDEIEQQREEQEQEQQNQEQEGENQDQEGDPSEDSEDGEESEQNPEENPEDQQQGQPDDSSPEEQEQEPEPAEESEEGEPAEAEPPPGEPQERVLTREEVMRLLEQLEKIEEEAEEIQAQLRDRRRVPVKRDW